MFCVRPNFGSFCVADMFIVQYWSKSTWWCWATIWKQTQFNKWLNKKRDIITLWKKKTVFFSLHESDERGKYKWFIFEFAYDTTNRRVKKTIKWNWRKTTHTNNSSWSHANKQWFTVRRRRRERRRHVRLCLNSQTVIAQRLNVDCVLHDKHKAILMRIRRNHIICNACWSPYCAQYTHTHTHTYAPMQTIREKSGHKINGQSILNELRCQWRQW